MNYNQAKFFSKIMWIIYILIGLGAITYIQKQQYKVPIIEENTTVSNQEEDVFFEVFGSEDVSTETDIENNKRSYVYKVEVLDELDTYKYQSISNNIIRDVESDIKKADENIDLNSIEVQFYIGNEIVHTYTHEN